MLLENTFGHDLDPNYLIEDNYRYSNDRDIIQISIKIPNYNKESKKA